jgi:hypothetical protein
VTDDERMNNLAALREPFPPEMIGKLPRVTCKDCSDRSKTCAKHQKTKCAVCSAYISTAHIHLDFVGHAELTDRLLTVDPLWAWEPFAYDQRGLPLIVESVEGDKMSGLRLWIRLTILDITRPGVGSVEKGSPDIEKQLIGDALRNAAMRFGVALDLWAKSDLAGLHDDAPDAPKQTTRRAAPARTQTLRGEVSGPQGVQTTPATSDAGERSPAAEDTPPAGEGFYDPPEPHTKDHMPTKWRNDITRRLAHAGVAGDDAVALVVHFATNRTRVLNGVKPDEAESVEDVVQSVERGVLAITDGELRNVAVAS